MSDAPRPGASGTPRTTVDTTADDALGSDDMTALIERIRRRDVSPGELYDAAQRRTEAANDRLNAVAAWTPDYRTSVPHGRLAGIPTLIKDNEDLAGHPTTHGSLAVEARPMPASTPWVSQFLALGTAPVAKTTLPEFGLTASTESSRFGATRNPWHTGHSVGGSSGGSAALVAAGVVPIAHANDGGGSIRIPASVNGLVGLKPSRGRLVDLPELERLPVQLAVQGVVTRSVRDTALYLAEAERVYRNPRLPEVGLVTGPSAQRLRIGVLLEAPRGLPVDPETLAAVERAAQACEGLGHHVEAIAVPVDERFASDFLTYWAFLAFTMRYAGSRLFATGFDGTRTEEFTKGLARMFRDRAEKLPMALRRMRRSPSAMSASGVDVILSPVVGHPAPEIGRLGPELDFRTHLTRLLRFTSFTPLQNVTGEPAISLPLARSSAGLPIGVQAAGRMGAEAQLLGLAYELEAALPWPRTPGGAG